MPDQMIYCNICNSRQMFTLSGSGKKGYCHKCLYSFYIENGKTVYMA